LSITIAQRYRPFSHCPGAFLPIPRSHVWVQLFPACLRFFAEKECELKLALKGPVRDFTAELDLERGFVRVFGHAQEGYFSYLLLREEKGIALICEKAPSDLLSGSLKEKPFSLKLKELIWILPSTSAPLLPSCEERLSLGMHKAQDGDLLRRRLDLKEIFPLWLRLAALTPQALDSGSQEGTFALLRECEKSVKERRRTEVVGAFQKLFLAGFRGLLVPRLLDDEFQGIAPMPSDLNLSPWPLLTQSARLIRTLFITEDKNEVALLPCLPPDFHAGRMTALKLEGGDLIDLEWTKKKVRRVNWQPVASRTIKLSLQKEISSFRVRRTPRDKGKIVEAGALLELVAGEHLLLDHFQK
jgi:hypothetical protein